MYIIVKSIESCTDIVDCMTAEEIREEALECENLSTLTELILCSWPSTNTEVQKDQ